LLLAQACRAATSDPYASGSVPHAVEAPASVSVVRPVPIDSEHSSQHCGAVRRAKRTWVGFAEGMTPDDMLPAAQATAAVVRALDEVFCSLLVHRERVPELVPERRSISDAAASGARFDVTHVTMADLATTRVTVRIRTAGGSRAPAFWQAELALRESGWQLTSIAVDRTAGAELDK
jgi:hypothetical protein